MKILSFPVFILDFSVLELIEGVDVFSVSWAGSFLLFFLFPESVITLPLLGFEVHFHTLFGR